MRQTAGLISTYSSDVFGVCSTLYELGGMVVMHDASGCNSTYTTHDEPRWYDMPSMIYISAISEMEAIMGEDEKLIQDIITTAIEQKPNFIAVIGAPIPYMIGTDFSAIAEIIEQKTKIPCFGFATNGMRDYLDGEAVALKALIARFCAKKERDRELSVNLLGATPLDFSLNTTISSIQEWLKENGMKTRCCFTMGCSFEQIKEAGRAQVNLVLSQGAYEAARYMEETLGIPYVVGVPYGIEYAKRLAATIKQTAIDKISRIVYQEQTRKKEVPLVTIIGEMVQSQSLAAAIKEEYPVETRVLCPLTCSKQLQDQSYDHPLSEDELMKELKKPQIVLADPMYRTICGENITFYDMPHVAFSGRLYEKKMLDWINCPLTKGEIVC